MIWSPLEQFAIIRWIPLKLGNFDFSLTNSSFYLILSLTLLLYLFYGTTRNGGPVIPSAWGSLVEMIYTFGNSLVKEQIGNRGRPYFPFLFSTFLFLLGNNVIGMIPYSFTTTSHFIVTFTLSVSIFIGITCIGFQIHGLHFFSFLFPPGAPLVLAPLLVVLELVSYCFRAISLGVRLFANMMAGHTLVKILAGFGWSMTKAGGILAGLSLIPYGIVFALLGLEIGVALLQAYVFTILCSIYLNDAIHLH
jgi:F-type H+-transporting ATPase subunit a